MTSKRILFCGFIFCLSGFSGCLQTRNEIRESEGKKNQETVTTMQRANAESVSRYSDLESNVRDLNGRVDVVENKISQGDSHQSKSQKAFEEQVTDHTRKLTLLEEEITKLSAQVAALEASAQSAKAVATAPVKDEKSDKVDKKTGFEIGEAQFTKKEWKKAILSYQKFRDGNPKAKKFPEATYKIGVCFQELGMKDEARTFYDELIGKFPKSDEARRAKIRLKKLK